jgi:hypothetical protein
MKIVGYILAGSVLLAIFQALIVATLAIGSVTLLLGAYFKPRETIGLLLVLLLWGLAANHPLACIVVAGLAYVAVKLLGNDKERGGQPNGP